jgi:hypothetical protein
MTYADAIAFGLTDDLDPGCPHHFGVAMRRLAGWRAYQRMQDKRYSMPPARRGTLYRSDNPFRACQPDRQFGWDHAYDHELL